MAIYRHYCWHVHCQVGGGGLRRHLLYSLIRLFQGPSYPAIDS